VLWKKAKRDLAQKQEEKRRKLQQFCLSRSRSNSISSDDSSNDSNEDNSSNDFELVKSVAGKESNSNSFKSETYEVTMKSYSWTGSSDDNSCDFLDSSVVCPQTEIAGDDEIKACLSSLESFFKELKSVKVW